MVMGGYYTAWSSYLKVGFWSYFGSLMLMASGYFCLALCLAEMSAALPFSGGTYGLARVTLGNFPAFFIGSCETIEYVLYTAFCVGSVSQLIQDLAGTNVDSQYFFFVVIYISVVVIHLVHNKLIWNLTSIFAVTVGILTLIYCLISAPMYGNFQKNVVDMHMEKDYTFRNWFSIMPFASFFFVGIETLPLACGEVVKAAKTIPRAIYLTISFGILMSVTVLFSCVSMSPGVNGLLDEMTPLSPGFSHLFKISHLASTSFALLATFAKLLGFSFAFVRQMTALAKSKLLVKFFPSRIMELSHSFRALFLGCTLGFILLFFNYRLRTQSDGKKADHYRHYFEATALICAFLSYVGIFVSYIAYKRAFHTLSKTYTSVLGIYGALYGILVFGAATISCIGFQNDNFLAILTFFVFMAFQLLYYLVSGQFSQIYSSEEQAVLFIAYIMKANNFKRIAIKRHSSQRTMTSSPRKKMPFHKQGTNTTMDVTQCNTTESSTAIHSTHSAAVASRKYRPAIHEEALNESRSDRDDQMLLSPRMILSPRLMLSPRTKELVAEAAQATGMVQDVEQGGSINAPVGDSFQGPAPPLAVKGREPSLMHKAAVRGSQYIRSFLAPIITRGISHRVLPFQDSFNNINEDSSPSRRNSDSSDGSSNRSLMHHYMEMMPAAYRPTDLDFDEELLATYQDALSQMHAYSGKIKRHHHTPSDVVLPFFEASTENRANDLVLRDIEEHHHDAASPKSLRSAEV